MVSKRSVDRQLPLVTLNVTVVDLRHEKHGPSFFSSFLRSSFQWFSVVDRDRREEVRRVYETFETVRSSDGGAMFEMARPEFKMMMEELAKRLTDVDDSLEVYQARVDRAR